MTTAPGGMIDANHGYAPINGLQMYYEIEGTGDPLIHIPPAFGYAGLKSFPSLVQRHSVVTMDLQGHGRTADIPDRPLTLEQYADDVVGLMRHLGLAKADFFGESYGGVAAIMIAVRYPGMVRRIATYGATFGPPEVALNPKMVRFDSPPTANSEAFAFQRESYDKVAPRPDYWPRFWDKVANVSWGGFSREELGSITAPVLIALGDRDFVRLGHAIDTLPLIADAELAVIPDAGHFALSSEPERVIPIVEHFLGKPEKRTPVATAGMGYHPGQTR